MPFLYIESADYCLLAGSDRGRCVIWKKPASGDKFAPYKDPVSHLDLVKFCSDFNYYTKVSGYPVDVTVNHAAVAADTGTVVYSSSTWGGFSVVSYLSVVEADYPLSTHGLGIVPSFVVLVNGVQYPGGVPIQVNGAGSRRTITFWADATKIYVRDSSRPSTVGLPAISVTYRLVVFRDPSSVAGAKLFEATPSRVRMGYGRVDSEETVMRDPIGAETSYGLVAGVVMDISNGQVRFVLPGGKVFDIGPLVGNNSYKGSFSGVAVKQVAIP